MKGMFKVAAATAVAGAVLVAGCSSDSEEEQSASFSPAVIYDTAGKFDKSFNEAVFRNGVEEFNADHEDVTVSEFEPQNEEQREQGLRRLASNGNSPIVSVGFNFSSSVEKVPLNSRTLSSPSSTLWLICLTFSPSFLLSTRVLSWLAHWQLWLVKMAPSVSSVVWTFR